MNSPLAAWSERAAALFAEQQGEVHRRTDRLFAGLMACQWLAGVFASLWISPLAWTGSTSLLHVQVYLAVLLGGVITAMPVALALRRPGAPLTRHCIAVCQALTSALLIHLTGGRIETHFHVFGSLAVLSFYRDWRVLISASTVVVLDHCLRGMLAPQSVYGVLSASPWRWLEHAGWVVFEDCFLVYACCVSEREMRKIADDQALIETTMDSIEQTVEERTQELESSERRQRAILASTADGIVGFDAAGRATFTNPAGERLLGRAGDRLLGSALGELCGAEAAARLRTPGGVIECRIARPDGSAITCELTSAANAQAGDVAGGMVVSLRDVTQRKELQSQLASSQKLEAIGQLAAGIAHEINTPTQYIGDNVRFLRDAFADIGRLIDVTSTLVADGVSADPAVAAVRELRNSVDFAFLREECPLAIAQSLDGVERVTRIVYSMKEFAHPDRSEKAAVDLNRVVASAATVCRNEWKYVADLQLELDPALPAIPGYAGDLGQVMLNLLVNAAHAIGDVVGSGGGAKGRIVVRSRLDGDSVVVQVEDTGAGIPDHVKPRIFEQFFTTKTVGKGSGQGLALVHRIVANKHGGRVWFESTAGRGTSFFVRLPVSAPVASEPAASEPAETSAEIQAI